MGRVDREPVLQHPARGIEVAMLEKQCHQRLARRLVRGILRERSGEAFLGFRRAPVVAASSQALDMRG